MGITGQIFSLVIAFGLIFLIVNLMGASTFYTFAPKLDYDGLCIQKAKDMGYPIQTRRICFFTCVTQYNFGASPAYLETLISHKTVVACSGVLFTQEAEQTIEGYKVKNSSLPGVGSKEIAKIVVEG